MHRHLLQLRHHTGAVADLGLTFSITDSQFGALSEVELKPGGGATPVTNDNVIEYIHRRAVAGLGAWRCWWCWWCRPLVCLLAWPGRRVAHPAAAPRAAASRWHGSPARRPTPRRPRPPLLPRSPRRVADYRLNQQLARSTACFLRGFYDIIRPGWVRG
jgi:hypothetical protein